MVAPICRSIKSFTISFRRLYSNAVLRITSSPRALTAPTRGSLVSAVHFSSSSSSGLCIRPASQDYPIHRWPSNAFGNLAPLSVRLAQRRPSRPLGAQSRNQLESVNIHHQRRRWRRLQRQDCRRRESFGSAECVYGGVQSV